MIFLNCLLLVGCSTPHLDTRLDKSNNDLLISESFMRYNTHRIDTEYLKESGLLSKAILSCHQGKFTKGLSILEGIMNENKENSLYWNALGTCYFLNKEFSKSLFFYQTGIEALKFSKLSSQKNIKALLYNNIGLLHLSFSRFNEAFDFFNQAESISPDLLTPKYNLAQLHLEFGNTDEALRILKSLFQQNKNDIDILYSLALIYLQKNDFKTSFSYIRYIDPDYLNRSDIVGIYALNLIEQDKLLEAQTILKKQQLSFEYDHRNKLVSEMLDQKLKEINKNKKH